MRRRLLESLSFLDRMIIAISCCRLLAQNRALPNARDIALAKLVRDTQQHKLHGNIEDCQVSRVATFFTRLITSEKRYETFDRVCKELSHKGASLTLLYFTPATLYKFCFNKEFYTVLLALYTRLLPGEIRSFENYCTKF